MNDIARKDIIDYLRSQNIEDLGDLIEESLTSVDLEHLVEYLKESIDDDTD